MEAVQIIEAVGSKAIYPDLVFSGSKSFSSYGAFGSPPPPILQPMRTQASHQERSIPQHTRNMLEAIPREMLFSALEHLDMASLIKLSAASYLLRQCVSAIPLMTRIRTSEKLTASFVAFRYTGTQKHFTLADFGAALKTVHCWYCQEKTQFGTLLNLMTCRRVCYVCSRKSKFCLPIPLKVVKDMFLIQQADITRYGIVLGRADIRHRKKIRESPDYPACGTWEHWTVSEDVLSLDAMIEPPCRDGGSEVFQLVNWLSTRHIESRKDPGSRRLLSLDELICASISSWSYKEDDARISCVAPLPYELQNNARPVTAFNCQGCARRKRYHTHPKEKLWSSANAAYLPAQLLEHVQTCESAQMILSGNRLRNDIETGIIWEMTAQMHKLFPIDGEFDQRGYILATIDGIACTTECKPREFFAKCEELKEIMEDAKVQAREE